VAIKQVFLNEFLVVVECIKITFMAGID